MIIPVGVSRRHVHLTKETFYKLFGKSYLEKRNDLTQPGQFASLDTVSLKWNNKIVDKVRVVGPFRSYNQIELSFDECNELEVFPPRRQSGDLNGSLPIILIGPKGKVYLSSGLIMAEAHVHMTDSEAKQYGYKDNEIVNIYKNDIKIGEAKIKVTKEAFLELHIDTDEEKNYDLHQNDEVKIEHVENR